MTLHEELDQAHKTQLDLNRTVKHVQDQKELQEKQTLSVLENRAVDPDIIEELRRTVFSASFKSDNGSMDTKSECTFRTSSVNSFEWGSLYGVNTPTTNTLSSRSRINSDKDKDAVRVRQRSDPPALHLIIPTARDITPRDITPGEVTPTIRDITPRDNLTPTGRGKGRGRRRTPILKHIVPVTGRSNSIDVSANHDSKIPVIKEDEERKDGSVTAVGIAVALRGAAGSGSDDVSDTSSTAASVGIAANIVQPFLSLFSMSTYYTSAS